MIQTKGGQDVPIVQMRKVRFPKAKPLAGSPGEAVLSDCNLEANSELVGDGVLFFYFQKFKDIFIEILQKQIIQIPPFFFLFFFFC